LNLSQWWRRADDGGGRPAAVLFGNLKDGHCVRIKHVRRVR
jgi:hypothetical protein